MLYFKKTCTFLGTGNDLSLSANTGIFLKRVILFVSTGKGPDPHLFICLFTKEIEEATPYAS